MSTNGPWEEGIEGNFPIHKNVTKVLPEGTRVVSAESCGISAWTKTAKVSAILRNGNPKRYFLKCIVGKGARALTNGEFQSAIDIDAACPGLVPKVAGWGNYSNRDATVYFIIGDFHNMDLLTAPEPAGFAAKIAEMHSSTSPNGLFGYSVPTVIGIMERTVTWEASWAKSFTNQLQDVIGYDNEMNGEWPELDAACRQLIDVVIPRLLGVLQSEGPLVHGDLWERNVGIDMETGETIIFDPGCTYAHNEMEFGTWRCSWAYHFNSPVYLRMYQRFIEPSEPVEEFDDRNRLYSIHPYLTDSAGHPDSQSRQIAYNDILYLCEKYGPLDSLERYDSSKDLGVTGVQIPFVMKQL
ncbi:hypothetical protein PG993_009512 [Apiospora rasikravindrae]|uniref:protein-ribulosamine 3-kinase n=1 Tax=Apiospora rasikravindrae TaxID=990691 RepID=A0ABR1SJK6_9PEZI